MEILKTIIVTLFYIFIVYMIVFPLFLVAGAISEVLNEMAKTRPKTAILFAIAASPILLFGIGSQKLGWDEGTMQAADVL